MTYQRDPLGPGARASRVRSLLAALSDSHSTRRSWLLVFAMFMPLSMGVRQCEPVDQCLAADGGVSEACGCEVEGKHYRVGESFAQDCNTCSCQADGSAVCTLKLCDVEPPTRACAGLTGLQCADDEYCSFAPDAQCGAADQTGVCQPKPEVCTAIYAPVCGCDDKTYSSDCVAAGAGVSILHKGECESASAICVYEGAGHAVGDSYPAKDGCNTCTCQQDGSSACTEKACEPPSNKGCDYNGEHHDAGDSFPSDDGCNTCHCSDNGTVGCTKRACIKTCGGLQGAQCAKGQYCEFAADAQCGAADQTGTCQPTPEACDAQYAPVCGCDDVTYSNACEAARAGHSVLSKGECPAADGCEYDGKHYAPGEGFPSSDGCNSCSCTDDGLVACTLRACAPVEKTCGGFSGKQCGDDQYCKFAADAICGIADATGVCTDRPEVCTAIYAPVCGCDNKTYSSDCVAASKGVGVLSEGECK